MIQNTHKFNLINIKEATTAVRFSTYKQN